MAYTAFDSSKPDPATQAGTAFGQSTRNNLLALRDMIVAGTMLGWGGTASGGTAEQPTQVLYARGTSEYVKATITWGTTGGANGNPSTVVYSYSAVSGGAGAYDTIGTITYTYDSNGNCTSWAWS